MKLFEVPYNFDEKLIPFYQKYKSYINYLYLPPYKDDSDNTRTSIQTNKKGCCYMPHTREEYEYHLKKIVSSGLSYVVLWQIYNQKLTIEILDYYSGLQVSGFIVASDKNAIIVKKYNAKLLSICSIVQRTCSNITKRELSYYDYVILYFPFNRGLDALKQLKHIKDKIILMPNSLCDVNCPSVHHWFPTEDKPFNPKKDCSMTIDNISQCALIFPEHLELFDDYVAGYKLQGREYPTEYLKYLCHFYFKREKYNDFVSPLFCEDMAAKLNAYVNNTPIEAYYNTKSSEILSKM